MAKMSFTKWSQIDVEEHRSEVTFMDREVAGGWYDYFCLDLNFRFRNYEHNCPDLEHSQTYRSDRTDALEAMTIESSVRSDSSSDSDSIGFSINDRESY